jgi:glucokinase
LLYSGVRNTIPFLERYEVIRLSAPVYVGIDLGGTTIKTGVCNEQGELLHKYEAETGTEHGVNEVVDRMARYARHAVNEAGLSWDQVRGIGAGVAGFLNMKEGIVEFSPNIPFRNTPLKRLLEEKLEKPILLNNDANVAALGEAWSGAGKGVSNLVLFTLGTGVGGGIIVGGKLVEGFRGIAGELGHISVVPDLEAIQCGCGQMGCVETVSSATGIIRMAKDAVERGDATSLALIERITAKDVFDAAKAGDEVAQRIVRRAAFYLGKTMAAVAAVLNPQRFIIGGGVSHAGDILFQPIREVFDKLAMDSTKKGVEIVPALLGNDAGMIGAAGLHLQ